MKHEWDWLIAAGFVLAAAGWFMEDGGTTGGRALMAIGLVVLVGGVVWQVIVRYRKPPDVTEPKDWQARPQTAH